MATKPTREQQVACDRLADALLAITEGNRLDGRGKFDAADLAEVSARIAKASSAFRLDEIVARALERRCRLLGLRSGSGDLWLLIEGAIKPVEALLLTDDLFKEEVAKLEEELGEA